MSSLSLDTARDGGRALAAREDAHLLPPPPPTTTRPFSDRSSSQRRRRRRQAVRILLSATASRLGSRCWEFALPLLLLEWSPNSLMAPASLGLVCALSRVTISPKLGIMADRSWDRMHAMLVGFAMQAGGCLSSVCVLAGYNWSRSSYPSTGATSNAVARLTSLALVITAGVVETLGSQLASVAVKKEWVPIVFDDEEEDNEEEEEEEEEEEDGRDYHLGSIIVNMSFVNASMINIDLLAAIVGPILTGWILQVLGGGGGVGDGEEGDGDENDVTGYSVQRGFAVIALMNAISFIPEMILLRRVYDSCPGLRVRRDAMDAGATAKRSREDDVLSGNPWTVWFHHPSGLPLLTLSLSSLYLTALSPSGVVLTAYLMTVGLSPTSIGTFRALGALSGVMGMGLFSFVRHRGEARERDASEDVDERSMSVRSIERLRKVSMAFLLLEVVSVLVAASSFAMFHSSSSSSTLLGTDDPVVPSQIVAFLGFIVLSRAGLYAFDLGALEIEQYIVDERFRNAVGSVEGALCSLAEMGMYAMSIVLSDPSDFRWQVGVSATAVSFGGTCFGSFLCMYHMHRHHHHDRRVGSFDSGECAHDHDHMHTMQQDRELEKYGYHVHLHRHPK
ncbi:hypothetical protein ACHAXA_006685 [Cyclostephanos tholiformis]|uniref:Solute carrier family 40 member n=1 Tax=Cyclostephanos tholiformis TaxID=382380 RepID=A0ABD3RFF4_9STRA